MSLKAQHPDFAECHLKVNVRSPIQQVTVLQKAYNERANLLAIFAITGTLTVSAVDPVTAGSLDASMADALSGRFVADGDLTILPAVAPTQGSAPPSYNYKEALPDYATVL